MKTLRFVLLVLAATVVAAPKTARAWSTQGGETLSPSENALHVGTGFPWALQTGYHIPLMESFELVPNFGFYYGQATTVPLVGNFLGVQLKFRALKSGNFHLALAGEPGFLMNYYPGKFAFGIQFGLPQVLATYNVTNVFALHFGLRMPIGILFNRYTEVDPWSGTQESKTQVIGLIPVVAHFGMEYSVSSTVNIFATMNMGVLVGVTSDGSEAEFYPAFIIGGAFRF